MNNVTLLGRLSKDIDVRYSQNSSNNTAIARTSIAVDRKIKRDGEPTADFINIIAFGKTAEFLEKYFSKGMRIGVRGHIQTGSYTNKDGVKVYTTDVIVDECEFVESKNSHTENNGGQNNNASGDGFVNIPDGIDEELPFN